MFYKRPLTLPDTGVLHTIMFLASCHTPFVIFNTVFSLIFLITVFHYPSGFVLSSLLTEKKGREKSVSVFSVPDEPWLPLQEVVQEMLTEDQILINFHVFRGCADTTMVAGI